MLTIRACATPPKHEMPALPKRLARIRRATESKRMDYFKTFHESLKKTAKDEAQFLKDLFKKYDSDDEDEEESTVDNSKE